ncbi:MAG: hypothetical protein ACKO2H_04300 [Bacteroidota bacterium]|nr:hypothetical protein [bacterium]NBP63506.1 hypothetical protein [Bacteroidota bacterium]
MGVIIQPEHIEDVWKSMAILDEQTSMDLVDSMEQQQPALLEYLMTPPEEFTDEEAENLMYAGIVIWKVFDQYGPSIQTIVEDDIYEIEDKNIDVMMTLEGESAGDGIVVIERMLESYPQPHLLASIAEILLVEDEDDDEEDLISDQARGTMMLILKTALDVLIAAEKK